MSNFENKVVTHITLCTDASAQNRPSYVYAKQFDSNSRYLIIKVVDSNGDVAISGNARLNIAKPDGTHSYISGEINDDGTVTVCLTANSLALDGVVSCDLAVIDASDDSVVLTTSTFYIIVDKSNYDLDAVESVNEFLDVTFVFDCGTATE